MSEFKIELSPQTLREYGIDPESPPEERFSAMTRWFVDRKSDPLLPINTVLTTLRWVMAELPPHSAPLANEFLHQLGEYVKSFKYSLIREYVFAIESFESILDLAIFNQNPAVIHLKESVRALKNDITQLRKIESKVQNTKWRFNWWYKQKARRILRALEPFMEQYHDLILGTRVQFVPLIYTNDWKALYNYVSSIAANPNSNLEFLKAVYNGIRCLLSIPQHQDIPDFLAKYWKTAEEYLKLYGIASLQEDFAEIKQAVLKAGFSNDIFHV
jgi:flagellar biosynthesis chaperone FliJ